MSTLFELVDEMQTIYDLATDPKADPELLQGSIDSVMGAIEVKATGYANLMKQLDMEAKQAKAVEELFKQKKEARENALKRMKEALKLAMNRLDVTKLEAGAYTFAIQNNSRASVVIDGNVPDNMNRVIIEPDKTKIEDYLKEQPDQKCGWAHLERGTHVRIR